VLGRLQEIGHADLVRRQAVPTASATSSPSKSTTVPGGASVRTASMRMRSLSGSK
jgi:hypothetical protein